MNFTEKIKRMLMITITSLILLFLIFNFRIFFTSPIVEIENFKANSMLVVDNDEFTLLGTAKDSKKLYINNKEIFLDSESRFSEKLYLSKYQNNFYIKSISKTGITFEKKIIIYRKHGEN